MIKVSGLLFLFFVGGIALAQAAPANPLFDQDAVQHISLTFQQADWFQELTNNYTPNDNGVTYLQASFSWGSYQFAPVGVSFTGGNSYNDAATNKVPFRIKLDAFISGQQISGVSTVVLNNAWDDPSFVREKPYYEFAASAGLATPRSNFAALYINGEYWGLYVLDEAVDRNFLTNHFGSGSDTGNLYKGHLSADGTQAATFAYLGSDPTAYAAIWEKETNADANDWTDLMALCQLIDQTPASNLKQALDPVMDVESVLTALALDNLTANLDSYAGAGENFYIYLDPTTNLWEWIPWNPALAFGAYSDGLTVQQLRELAIEWTVDSIANTFASTTGAPPGGFTPPGGTPPAQPMTRPLAEKLWQVPEYAQQYQTIYQNLVNQFQPSSVAARMATLQTLISPYVAQDTQDLVTQQQFNQSMTTDIALSEGSTTFPTAGGFAGGITGAANSTIPGLQPFVSDRVLSLNAQLSGGTALRAITSPGSLLFAAVANGANPAPQTVALTLSDATQVSTDSVAISDAWLTATVGSGTSPDTITVSVSTSGLTAGTYTGSVMIAVANTVNNPVIIPVTFVVPQVPSVVVNPASLTFISLGGGIPPGSGPPTGPGGGPGSLPGSSQTFQVISTGGPASFFTTISAPACSSAFSTNPSTGTTPTSISVTANTILTSDCTGTITVWATGLASASVNVTITSLQLPTGSIRE